ncbi:MAG: TIM barrel protein [Methanomassiliicoccales archaeon]
MIRFGPAGIPLSCKGRTLKDGIEDVHNLGLNAMEVQMVRVNVIERYPDEEEIGLSPVEVEGDLIMEMLREGSGGDQIITDLTEGITEDDVLITLASGLVQNHQELRHLGKMGKELDVQLSMHTPYYMDLASNNDLTEKSMDNMRWAGVMTHHMGGHIVSTHMGLYGKQEKEVSTQNITENIRAVMEWWKEAGLTPYLGLETSGRQEVFGTLDEVMDICDQVDGAVPVVNFAHLHARENGILREPEDFGDVLDRVRDQVGELYYTHFSGVEHEAGNEKRVTPIKKGDLRFEPLAEYLVENFPDLTVISSSPLLEHDAMYMKVIFERVLTKKVSKLLKEERKEKESAKNSSKGKGSNKEKGSGKD